MSTFRRIGNLFSRIANLFRRTRIDREIDAELRAHISMRIEDNVLPVCRRKRLDATLWCALSGRD